MATENPTGDGRAVSLSTPAGNKAFLRRVISATQDGLRDDLAQHGDQLCEPRSGLLLEDAAYAALLDGLDRGAIVPDNELRATLARLGEAIDHENEYERVVFEHEAVAGLLTQLGGAVAE